MNDIEHFELALNLMKEDAYEAAVGHLEAAVEVRSEKFGFWVRYAYCLTELGRYEDAVRAAEKTLDLASTSRKKSMASIRLGYACLKWSEKNDDQALLKRARTHLRNALDYDENPLPRGYVLDYLGVAENRLGNTDEAMACHRKCMEVDPGIEDAPFNLAMILRSRDRGQAIALLRRALEIEPGFVKASCELSELLLEEERRQEADDVLRAAYERSPTDSTVARQLARQIKKERPEEAERICRRMIELDPGDA
jgi:tetratricopeptide (TPR) repeat protein